MHELTNPQRTPGSIKEGQVFVVDMSIPKCQYNDFQQSGKLCVHLIAAKLEGSNGPVEDWKGIVDGMNPIYISVSFLVSYRVHQSTKSSSHMGSAIWGGQSF